MKLNKFHPVFLSRHDLAMRQEYFDLRHKCYLKRWGIEVNRDIWDDSNSTQLIGVINAKTGQMVGGIRVSFGYIPADTVWPEVADLQNRAECTRFCADYDLNQKDRLAVILTAARGAIMWLDQHDTRHIFVSTAPEDARIYKTFAGLTDWSPPQIYPPFSGPTHMLYGKYPEVRKKYARAGVAPTLPTPYITLPAPAVAQPDWGKL